MIKRKKCTVEECSLPRFAKGLCQRHQYLRTDGKGQGFRTLSSSGRVPIKRTPIKRKYKASGEMEVFKMIWNERERVCFCCNKKLLGELHPSYFSHVLAKGTYGKFRLLKDNIVLCCVNCHNEWEFTDRSDKKFERKKELYLELQRRYNGVE